MEDKANREFGIPRISNDPENRRAIRRKDFFPTDTNNNLVDYDDLYDHTRQKCFYGPGQRPDSGEQDGWDTNEQGVIPKQYRAPHDWPAKSTVLKVPQVVFLSKRIANRGSFSAIIDNPFWYQYQGGVLIESRDTDGSPCGMAYSDSRDIYWAIIEAQFQYKINLPDHLDEEDRLDDVFSQVAQRINALRPGKTFVTYWDKWGINGDVEGGDFGMDDTMDHLLAPPLSENKYLGTDFLNIYAGPPIERVEDTGSPVLDTDSDVEDNFFFSNSAERIKAAFPRFYRYNVWAWATRFDGEGIDWEPLITVTEAKAAGAGTFDQSIIPSGHRIYPNSVIPQNPFFDYRDVLSLPFHPCDFHPMYVLTLGNVENSNYLAAYYPDSGLRIPLRTYWTGTEFHTDPLKPYFDNWVAGQSPPASYNDSKTNAINSLNNNEESYGQFLKKTCDALSDYGVAFKGSIADLNADDLVHAIAEHFNFDPSSGKDL